MSTGNGKGPQRPAYRSRPFFDSAAFYAVLAVLGFGVLLLTGQNALRAAGGALLAFVLATGATWFNVWRRRDRSPAAKEPQR